MRHHFTLASAVAVACAAIFAGGSYHVQAQAVPGCPVGYTCTPIAFCHDFGSNMSLYQGGGDVPLLKKALSLQGMYAAGEIGPAFDAGVSEAVKTFQVKYASEILAPLGLAYGTGYVGPLTRAKLNQLYSCQRATSPLTISNITVSVAAPSPTVPAAVPTASSSTTATSSVTYTAIAPRAPMTGAPILSQGPNGTIGFTQSFTYTLNAGNYPLYVSTNPLYAVGTTSIGAKNASAVSVTAAPSQLAGDTSSSFVIPAGGFRTFTVIASVNNQGGSGLVSAAFQITKLYYSASQSITSIPATYIDFGLNALQTLPQILLTN